MEELPKTTKRVQEVLDRFELELKVVKLPESTRTSKAAAETIGCEVGQIAKSIIFNSNKCPILVIASGRNRVNISKLEKIVDDKVNIMNPTKVKEVTGFGIGGVAPVGHKTKIMVFIDEDLLEYDIIWAAAGTPDTVFALTPKQLVEITDGKIVDVKE